jgi:hypothetical protein
MLVFYIRTLEELDSIKKKYEIVLAIADQFVRNSDLRAMNYWNELTGDEDDSWTLKGGEELERQNEVFSEQVKMLRLEIDLTKKELEKVERENIELRENFIKVNYVDQDADTIFKDLWKQAKLAKNKQLVEKMESMLEC